MIGILGLRRGGSEESQAGVDSFAIPATTNATRMMAMVTGNRENNVDCARSTASAASGACIVLEDQ